MQAFERLAHLAFKRSKIFNVSLFKLANIVLSYLADGLYTAKNIEAGLKQVFGTDKGILDHSYAAENGIKIGIPVATTGRRPESRIFTNYNGVGSKDANIVKPKKGPWKARLWEM